MHRIFEAQRDVSASHEGVALPWEVDACQLWYAIVGIQTRCEAKIFANSSLVWMRYAGKMMAELKDPKFICLKRPKEEVVDSFLRHIPTLNHWTDQRSRHWSLTKDSATFQSIAWPKYDAPKAEALARYWEAYYSQAAYLQSRFPDNFRIFDMRKTLNTESGQRAMLKFAGFDTRNIFLDRKLNALGKPKGHLNPEEDYVFPGQSVSG